MTPGHGGAATRIATDVRQAILDGVYEPGHRIRQEQLAESNGASRVPAREALRMLEAEGLVTLVANTGAWVRQLTRDDCDELYRMRERLEPLLLRFNLSVIADDTVELMAELADRMELADIEQFIRLDREYHLLSYSSADTSLLGGTVLQLWNRTQHYRRAFLRLTAPRTDRHVHLEHHLLVDAVRRRDNRDAEGVLLMHIRRTRLELGRHPEVFHPQR